MSTDRLHPMKHTRQSNHANSNMSLLNPSSILPSSSSSSSQSSSNASYGRTQSQFSLSRAEQFQNEMVELMESHERLTHENADLKWRLSQRNEDLLQRITSNIPKHCTDAFLDSLRKHSIHLDSVGDVALSSCMQEQFDATCAKSSETEMRSMRALIRIQFEKLKAQQRIIADCSTRLSKQATALANTQAQLAQKSAEFLALQNSLNSLTPYPKHSLHPQNSFRTDKSTQQNPQPATPNRPADLKTVPAANPISSTTTLQPRERTHSPLTQHPNDHKQQNTITTHSRHHNEKFTGEQQSIPEIQFNEHSRMNSSSRTLKELPRESSNNNIHPAQSTKECSRITAFSTSLSQNRNQIERPFHQADTNLPLKERNPRDHPSKENDYPTKTGLPMNNPTQNALSNNKNNANKGNNQLNHNSQSDYPFKQQHQHQQYQIIEPKRYAENENSCTSYTLRRANSRQILLQSTQQIPLTSATTIASSSSLSSSPIQSPRPPKVLKELPSKNSNSLNLPLQQNRRCQSQYLHLKHAPSQQHYEPELINPNHSSPSELSRKQSHPYSQNSSLNPRLLSREGSPHNQANSNSSEKRFLQPDSTRSLYSLQASSHRSLNQRLRTSIDEFKQSNNNYHNCNNNNNSSSIMITEDTCTLLTEPSTCNNNSMQPISSRSSAVRRRSRAERQKKSSGSKLNSSASVNNDYNTFNPLK